MKVSARHLHAAKVLAIGLGIAAYSRYVLGPDYLSSGYRVAIVFSFVTMVVPAILAELTRLLGRMRDE